jgi:hypothetical protein
LPESRIKPPQSVSDAFCAAVREATAILADGLAGVESAARQGFAERLVTRLVFLKFVEQHGWLDGDSDFLFRRFRDQEAGDFWSGFLRPMLSPAMAAPPGEGTRAEFAVSGCIPFLSPWLFTPPDGWDAGEVRMARRALGSVFDVLLNRFRFDAAGDGAAVCPDWMASAYEGLISDRHGKGAYYTDPAEVSLMCRESLLLFLKLRCPEVAESAIGELLSAAAPDGQELQLPHEHGLALFRALSQVTICDPAVGAGSFPVGMVRQLFAALCALGRVLRNEPQFRREVAAERLPGPDDRFRLKADIIGRSVYGCDIDAAAVEIARVRLWLELMVESKAPVLLPSLDYNFLVGDALVSGFGLDEQGRLLTLEETVGPPVGPQRILGAQLPKALGDLRTRYYSAENPSEQHAWREEIEAIRAQALASLGGQRGSEGAASPVSGRHVLWPIDFAEVFQHEDPGFDIVVANPPYVRKEEIEPLYRQLGIPLTKRRLQEVYRRLVGEAISGHADLYLYFYFRGLSLLKRQDGVLCFISSNAWLDVGYGQSLRKHLLERTRLAAVIENRAARSFPGADINTVIVLCSTDSSDSKAECPVRFVSVRGEPEEVLAEGLPGRSPSGAGVVERENVRVISVRHKDLAPELLSPKADSTGGKWGGRYLRAPSVLHRLLNELEWRPLGQVADVVTYLNTGGCDDFFFVRVIERRDGEVKIASQAFPDECFWVESRFVVPLVRSPLALARPLIRLEEVDHYLLRIPESTSVDSLAVNDYLECGRAKGFAERSGSRNRSPWWKLPVQAFTGYRILVSRHHHDRFNVFYNPEEVVANSFYGLVVRDSGCSEEALMAALSSTLSVLLAETYGRTNQGQGVLNTYGEDLSLIPVFACLLRSTTDWRAVLFPYLERSSKSLLEDCGYEAGHGATCPLAPSPERAALDSAVFDCLGITTRVREEIIRSACELVEERLRRAASRAGSGRREFLKGS